MKRKIVRIDEAKCTGCGQCADACAEGAIKIVDGKARLVSSRRRRRQYRRIERFPLRRVCAPAQSRDGPARSADPSPSHHVTVIAPETSEPITVPPLFLTMAKTYQVPAVDGGLR